MILVTASPILRCWSTMVSMDDSLKVFLKESHAKARCRKGGSCQQRLSVWPRFLGMLFFGLSMFSVCLGKEWKGIVPMQSTRSEVIRILGASPYFTADSARYSLADVDVHIAFSNETCGRVAKDTVLVIEIIPKTDMRLSDLHLDKAALETFDRLRSSGDFHGYFDKTEGWFVRTFKISVDRIAYVANSEDRKHCSEYYERYYQQFEEALSPSGHPIPLKLDEYGDLPFAEEKARLDAFTIQLKSSPDSSGYLIFYSGRDLTAVAAQARAKRAQDYLSSKIEAKRIIVIDGGRRQEFAIELFLRFTNDPAPRPHPDPNP
jgi:hypothetical protein